MERQICLGLQELRWRRSERLRRAGIWYALHKLYEFGDAIISTKNGRGFLATTDFSNKYIKRVRRFHCNLKGKILVFNYTDWKYEAIHSNDITYITPLAKMLKNERPEL